MPAERLAIEPAPPADDAALEERLSLPSAAVLDAFRHCPGDVLVLGAGGKMGPSLARMAHRAATALVDEGSAPRRVIAVSRFSSPHAEAELRAHGIETIAADLGDAGALASLPDPPNVVYMAGQKFGTSDLPSLTWVANTVMPARVGERFAGSRIVAFSTGNVYPLTPVEGPGSREDDALTPIGEYANSCVGRERVLEHLSRTRGTPLALVRLSYAVDLRYGVLVDIALRIAAREPVDVGMGRVNVIWQGDANAQALASLAHASSPPFVVNVTGPERLHVRSVAERLGRRLGRPARIVGEEGPDALLSDTSRAVSLFGKPSIPADVLIDWVADWVRRGGTTLAKPTHFETRDGRF